MSEAGRDAEMMFCFATWRLGRRERPRWPEARAREAQPEASSRTTEQPQRESSMARIKDDSSDEEDEVPLSKRAAPGEAEVPALPPARVPPPVDDSEEEDDVPLSKRKALVEAVSFKPAPAAKKQKVEPKPANGKPKPAPAVKAKPKPQPADESDSDVEPAAKKAKKPASTNKEKEGPSTSYGDRWYEEVDGSEWKRGGVKWKTLEHGGVMFPPLYTPHGKKLMYEGKPVVLSAAQEEVGRPAQRQALTAPGGQRRHTLTVGFLFLAGAWRRRRSFFGMAGQAFLFWDGVQAFSFCGVGWGVAGSSPLSRL